MRLFALVLVLVILVVTPLIVCGEGLQSLYAGDGAVRTFGDFAHWARLAAVDLWVLDLFLPLPATQIISVQGYFYSPVLGTLFAVVVLVLSALLGYVLCRALARFLALDLLPAVLCLSKEALLRKPMAANGPE